MVIRVFFGHGVSHEIDYLGMVGYIQDPLMVTPFYAQSCRGDPNCLLLSSFAGLSAPLFRLFMVIPELSCCYDLLLSHSQVWRYW